MYLQAKATPADQKIKKTVIIAGYACNNHCRFCINNHRRGMPIKTTSQIIREMIDASKRGRTYLEMIGGEITTRPDFFRLIQTAKTLGFKNIVIATNGRMLSYEAFAERAISAGITDIIFSIHGHTPKLHDSLTRVSGSFHQLLRGIENVKKSGMKAIGSNTTIVKQNYQFLPAIGQFLKSLGIKNSEFIFVDPTTGGAKKDFRHLVPKISRAAPFIRKCLDIAKKDANLLHWHARYIPWCHFLGYENQISEFHERLTFHTEHLAPDFRNFEVEKSRAEIGRVKTKKCRNCCYFSFCEGVWREYLEFYGDKEFAPPTFPSQVFSKIQEKL